MTRATRRHGGCGPRRGRGRALLGGGLVAAGAAGAALWYGVRVLRSVRAPAPLRPRVVCAGGHRIHTLVAEPSDGRTGAPVVLLHGWGVSGRYYVPTARALARERPVYLPDLPGHGRSERPPRALDVDELAGVVLAWMDRLGVRRAVLIGNSFGCQIAAELALRVPERVLGLGLVGPTLDPAARPLARLALRLVRTGLFEPLSLYPILLADYATMGPRRLVGELGHMLRDRIEARLPRITQPSLVVRGRRDAVAAARWIAQVAALLGTGPAVTLSRGAHGINYSAPGELLRALRPLLAAADAADAGCDAAPASRRTSSAAPDPGAP